MTRANENTQKKLVTLPVSVDDIDGIPYMKFTYTEKGQSVVHEIRVDIENALPTDDFKALNCVYPKANCAERDYQGNRFSYESTVNEIGWKLSFLNPNLIGKRGLLQRAVDRYKNSFYISYRNQFPSSTSRRVARKLKPKPVKVGQKKRDCLPSKTQKKIKETSDAKKPKTAFQSVTEDLLINHNPVEVLSDFEVRRRAYVEQFQRESEFRELFTPPELLNVPQVFDEEIQTEQKIIYHSNPENHKYMTIKTVKSGGRFEFDILCDSSTEIPESYTSQHVPFNFASDHRQLKCNNIARKLSFLNPEIFEGYPALLQRAVDVYMVQFEPVINWPPRRRRLYENQRRTFDTSKSPVPESPNQYMSDNLVLLSETSLKT